MSLTLVKLAVAAPRHFRVQARAARQRAGRANRLWAWLAASAVAYPGGGMAQHLIRLGDD